MNSLLDRLNLRPQERRFVVLVFTVLFVVVNVWLVWPRFKDWNTVQNELDKAKSTLQRYQKVTAQDNITALNTALDKFNREGATVAASAQSFDLIRTIQNQAIQSGVGITANSEFLGASTGKTNEYFEERARKINVLTGEKELVDFLVSIGSADSMIRARSMILRVDPTGTRLQGDITLVATYQKTPKTVPPAAKTGSTATSKPALLKPATAPGKTDKVAPDTKPKTSAPAAPSARPVEKPKKT